MIMEDIKRTISELEQESSLSPVGVELVDNELATLYMNSKKSEVKFFFFFYDNHLSDMYDCLLYFGVLHFSNLPLTSASSLCFEPTVFHLIYFFNFSEE